MADSQDLFDELDACSEAANETETKLIIIFVLEIMSGAFGFIYAAMHFSIGLSEGPLIMLILYVSQGVLIAVLAVLSLVAGWSIWRLEPWAWRTAVAVSIAFAIISVITPILLIFLLNVVLLWYLKSPQVREVYSGIGYLWTDNADQTPQ